jgi:hypothetical protein
MVLSIFFRNGGGEKLTVSGWVFMNKCRQKSDIPFVLTLTVPA